MSSTLRKLLQNAVGESQDVVAVVIDVRGFTQFCQAVGESMNIATFVRRVYIEIMDRYFRNASFHKPTGDGLLIVIPYTSDNLTEVLCNTVRDCLDITKNFRKLTENDPMINFDTPEKVGIGISRGVVCRISSKGIIVDYSGKVINLASRLNDFARPSGIVFDSSFGFKMLPKDVQAAFHEDAICIRGIAEEKPLKIYFTKEQTIIPPSRRRSFKQPKWEVDIFNVTLEQLEKLVATGADSSRFVLSKKPIDEGQISIEISFKSSITGTKTGKYLTHEYPWVKCVTRGKEFCVFVRNKELIEHLKSRAAKDKDLITAEIQYPTEEE